MPASQQQKIIRNFFKRCATCFNAQPETGGATPPALGPRGRDYWYTSAAPSGLWYYDYFMQQSMNEFLLDGQPDWCTKSQVVVNRYRAWGRGYGYGSGPLEENINTAWNQLVTNPTITTGLVTATRPGMTNTILADPISGGEVILYNMKAGYKVMTPPSNTEYLMIRNKGSYYSPDGYGDFPLALYKVADVGSTPTTWYNSTGELVLIQNASQQTLISGDLWSVYIIPNEFLNKTGTTSFRLEYYNRLLNRNLPPTPSPGHSSSRRQFIGIAVSWSTYGYYMY